MFKLFLILLALYCLIKEPKAVLSLAAIIGGIVFVFSHPILCIVGFLVLCFIIGWIEELKGKGNEKSYETYNRQNQNQQQYRQKTNNNQRQQQETTYTKQKKFSYFSGCITKEQLKKRHRELCMKYHPDKGGNIEQFRKMQEEYEILRKKFN